MQAIATEEDIQSMPKLEMHIHLEGTISPERVKKMADELGEELPRPIDQLYETKDLTLFLATLDWVCSLVRTPEQARDIALDFAHYCKQQNIVYAEVIVNPTHWAGLGYGELLPALSESFDEAETLGLADIRILPSLLRQQSEEESLELVNWMVRAKSDGLANRILGLSVDGNEAAAGPSGDKFAAAYALARESGFGCTAHAGESSGPQGVLEALDKLGVSRIDHGVRAAEDQSVVDRLEAEKITLNVCLSSNCALLYDGIEQHPIKELVEAGVPVTLNTDDPVVLEKTLNQELVWAANSLGWSLDEMIALQRNAVASAFCSETKKSELLAVLSSASV